MNEFEEAYAGEMPHLDFDLPPLPSVIRYYDDFEDKFNLDLNLSFSVVKKNATNNYFRVTSS